MKKVVFYFTFLVLLSSCSKIIVPYHTTVDKITAVKPGMSKQNVIATLSVDPYEIYHGIEAGCEIHHFKYKHKEKYFGTLNSFGNVLGADRYVKPSNLYVYYRDGKMESLITDNGKDSGPGILSFMDELDFECNGGPQPIYGCMDKDALNYNNEATVQRDGEVIENGSTIMIGDCEYCACDYMVNVDYNSKTNCGERCIPIPKEEAEEEEVITHFDPDCTLCDLAEKENAQINVNIDFDNEKPQYNGYISKLFGNQINVKNKVSKNKKPKRTKKKKNRSNNHTMNKSSKLSAGLIFSGGFGPMLSRKDHLTNNVIMSNSVVYFIDAGISVYEEGLNEEGLYIYSNFKPIWKTSNEILFNLISSKNYSLKAGVGSGIAIGTIETTWTGFELENSSKLTVESLSIAVSNQFKRFGLSANVPVVKLDNYLSPGYLGINYNF